MRKSLAYGAMTAIAAIATLPAPALATGADGTSKTQVATGIVGQAVIYGPAPVLSEKVLRTAIDSEGEMPDGMTVAVSFATLALAFGGVVAAMKREDGNDRTEDDDGKDDRDPGSEGE